MNQDAAALRTIHRGNRNQNPPEWTPFEWNDPLHGLQAKGEVTVIVPEGSSGELAAGLWRTGHHIAGCDADGSCTVVYSAPLGDETMVLLEGTARITETLTGKVHQVGAGSIISNPKGVDLHWAIDGPFLKKFWVMWNSPHPVHQYDHLFVSSIHDNPASWRPFEWDEPGIGLQAAGELHLVRDQGSTGTYLCGLWRTGPGVAGCETDGSLTARYSAPLGDETSLLLEGAVQVVREDTGERFDFVAGDIICLPKDVPVRWTSCAPFVKKFFVITNAELPL